MLSLLNRPHTIQELAAATGIEFSPLAKILGVLLAPALYNIGQGIGGKVDTLDPYGYQVRTKYAYPKQNITPVISDIRSQGAMARRMAGSDMASQIAATASTQEALSDVYTRKQAIEDQRFMEAQRYGMMAEQFNVANRLGIEQYNMQAQAAKENMLGEGISQLGTVASGYGQEILQKRWLDQMGTMYDKYLAEGKISNEEYLKKLEELQKSKTDLINQQLESMKTTIAGAFGTPSTDAATTGDNYRQRLYKTGSCI